jgi:3',5'-cyclic AMP phosphodiesterase CpdA
MEHFTIAHISDLHFSPGADKGSPHTHSISHLKQIQSVLKDRPLDRMIVSGDLTDRGDTESLLRVRDWLFDDFSISGGERIGLKMSEDVVRVVPGNHDAYNADKSPGNSLNCWQKSIDNYRQVFPSNRAIQGCDYEWIEKGEFGFYIAYIDSCFLGDPTLRRVKEFRKTAIHAISKIARGKMSLRQSRQLIEWFDLGMRGELRDTRDENARIAKDKFAKSFKMLVMHHYLFEPKSYADDFFLNFDHRDTVFQNIAQADFDMYLCGHKHVSDFHAHYYGEHFDHRAKGRYIMNLFRRRIGANTLSLKFKDANGKMMSWWFNIFIELSALMVESRDIDDTAFIDTLTGILENCLKNPAKFGDELQEFVKTYKLSGLDLLDEDSIQEIQTRIAHNLSKSERDTLAKVGITYIRKIAKGMSARPFLQSMCGSSCKASHTPNTPRSFNIYDFEFDEHPYNVKRTRFNLKADSIEESVDDFSFSNHCHITLRGGH